MPFLSEPPISVKIRKMKERVRWEDPLITQRGIDQTRMVIDDGFAENPEFSFLVIGDSGSGYHRGYNPQRKIAELMLAHKENSSFVLHTGDVIYLVGSSEYYPKNFIKPYREFLLGGEEPKRIAYDRMTFTLPILPVPGNHDYYDVSLILGLLAQTALPFRRLLKSQIDFDVMLHGSFQGKAYAQAFLDYLKAFQNQAELGRHLDRYYTAKTDTGRCLSYQPGRFTRLPNRYYTFRYGGIDFFAVDSNTFNAPLPLPTTRKGKAYRRELEKRLLQLEQEKEQILDTSGNLDPNLPEEAEYINDLQAKLEQIDEMELDINKQLASNETTVTDFEQLDWLKQKLIASWHTKEVRGRIIYFHHPPYVTEATKWYQGQTLAVRRRLRQVLDEVSSAVGSLPEGRPLVDLILNGHAHCLEYIRTGDTGHADSHLNWIVCGGSGYSLRRQRIEGPELTETFEDAAGISSRKIAESLLFVGREGQGKNKRRPYSFLRIDVKEGRSPKFIVRPFIAEWFQHEWNSSAMEPFVI
ncbi:metallophosphoesterase family protein [Aerosakkonema funiforme]|uniref:Metallophosphoesterase n=2 Tax=Oscillatoriophycideae TaxID=1301283 RepID=A0A926VA00_9CYAN|nr:metallophosphoesterase [Aerosakkonema funiforme]MBD2180034.1 metallophosphoesterase [Aerosakkonema funiforme FACHB-1375]